jgi:hypothetical protein
VAFYPSTINAGDILILHASMTGSTTIAIPTGWNNIGYSTYSPWMTQRFCWKRATGSESGWFTFNPNDTNQKASRIHRFGGCLASGTPVEALTWGTKTNSATMAIPSITTTNNDELCIALCGYRLASGYGNDNATYYSEVTDDPGYPATMAIFFYDYVKSVAGVVPADSFTCGPIGAYHFSGAFALIPASGYSNKPLGISPGNIGNVDGVNLANIANIIGV